VQSGKLFPGKLSTVVKEHSFWYFEVFVAAKKKERNKAKQNDEICQLNNTNQGS